MEEILNEMLELYEAKNHDYGNSFDQSLDEFGLIASVVRLNDKMNRIKALMKANQQVNDESLEDTLMDLANYAVMTLAYMRHK